MKCLISFCLFCFFFLSSHSEGLSLTDDSGRLIEIDEPPKTIVSLSPHLTELLFDLGVGQTVVGTVVSLITQTQLNLYQGLATPQH